MIHKLFTGPITDERLEMIRQARTAAIEVAKKYRDLNEALLLVGGPASTERIEANDRAISEICEHYHIRLDIPQGSYWDEEHLAGLSDAEAYGEIQLHQNQLAYHDGDDPSSKSEREFAIQMIDYIATLHPDCFAR